MVQEYLHHEKHISIIYTSAVYVPIVEVVDEIIGYSCTIPHKENIAQRCDEADPVAKVNYIVII
ncbi:putative shikimate dehydrogenase substrate binding protein [Helianthus anomalus]